MGDRKSEGGGTVAAGESRRRKRRWWPLGPFNFPVVCEHFGTDGARKRLRVCAEGPRSHARERPSKPRRRLLRTLRLPAAAAGGGSE